MIGIHSLLRPDESQRDKSSLNTPFLIELVVRKNKLKYNNYNTNAIILLVNRRNVGAVATATGQYASERKFDFRT